MSWLRLLPGVLRLVPMWVWILLAVAVLYRGAIGYHQRQVRDHDRELLERRDGEWRARIAALNAKAAKVARAAEATAAQINQHIGADHAKAASDIRAIGAELRRLQPPRQATAYRARSAGSVGTSVAGGPGRDDGAGGPVVPGMAEIPWLELVARGESCDLDRNKLTALQRAWREQGQAYEDWRNGK